ncbi:MAG TPA: hypothetical protein VFO16_09170 [Pseudonocardiaceae bacterium]|nr:hypothetical protein [Pseudonocardiaceae bacterium]
MDLYPAGLRDQIEQIRQDTTRRGSPCRQPGSRASEDSLRRRLELAHQRISQLRAENQQLRQDLAIAHGHLRAAASGGIRP